MSSGTLIKQLSQINDYIIKNYPKIGYKLLSIENKLINILYSPKPVIFKMTLASGTNSGTTDKIIFRWIYSNNNGYSNYITLATAPPAGAIITGTFTPNQTISGIQITCSGNDGFEMSQLSFNGTAAINDLGWIDLNSTNGSPAYINYSYTDSPSHL